MPKVTALIFIKDIVRNATLDTTEDFRKIGISWKGESLVDVIDVRFVQCRENAFLFTEI